MMARGMVSPASTGLQWVNVAFLSGNANSPTPPSPLGGSLKSAMLLFFDIFTSVLSQRFRSAGTWLLAILFLLLLDGRLGIFSTTRSRVGSLITGLGGNS